VFGRHQELLGTRRVRGDRLQGIVVVGRRGRQGCRGAVPAADAVVAIDCLFPLVPDRHRFSGRGGRHVDILFGLHLGVGSLVVQELMLALGVLIQSGFATIARE